MPFLCLPQLYHMWSTAALCLARELASSAYTAPGHHFNATPAEKLTCLVLLCSGQDWLLMICFIYFSTGKFSIDCFQVTQHNCWQPYRRTGLTVTFHTSVNYVSSSLTPNSHTMCCCCVARRSRQCRKELNPYIRIY